MRAFCSNSQSKTEKAKIRTKTQRPIKENEIKATPEDKMIEKNNN